MKRAIDLSVGDVLKKHKIDHRWYTVKGEVLGIKPCDDYGLSILLRFNNGILFSYWATPTSKFSTE